MKIIKEKQSKSKIKVSVLISTFNKANYIGDTLDSILTQSMNLQDIELIVVDDCSTDNTINIVSEKIGKFLNYKLVQLDENSGTPGKPRNLSIDLSRGKYLMFIDGDDWLPTDSIETLYSLLRKNKTDYAAGLTKYFHNDRLARAGVILSKIPYSKTHFRYFRKAFYHLAPAGRMVKSNIIKKNDIRFPEMIFGEDLQFFAEVFFNTKKISTTNKVVYYANRYTDNVSLVRSKESTTLNRMKLQHNAYIHLAKSYKNDSGFANLLYRIINKDILEAKFYKKDFIKNIDDLLPVLQNVLEDIEKDFDPLKYVDDELNKQAIKLIIKGNKEEVIKFVKFYLNKDEESIHTLNGYTYYLYNGILYKKNLHVTLSKIIEKENKVYLKLDSKNSDIKYLEIKNFKDPTDYKILKLKSNPFKKGEYSVQFQSDNLQKGKWLLRALDKDYNNGVIKSSKQFGFYDTVNGNLGFKKEKSKS